MSAPVKPIPTPKQRLGVECAALCLSSVASCLAFWWFFERARYASVLSLAGTPATDAEALLVAWTVCAETLLFSVPGVLAAALAFSLQMPRVARRSFLIWSSAALVFESLDLRVYGAFGRHLAELARFALLPGAAQIAGSVGHWLMLIGGYAAIAAGATTALTWAARRIVFRIAPELSIGFRRVLASLSVVVVMLGMALPAGAEGFYRHPAIRAGLRSQLIWAPPASAEHEVAFHDPNWVALDAGLRQSYERLFPFVFAEHPLHVTSSGEAQRPNVLLIVFESFRADSLTDERMPRLTAWAHKGLVANQHFAGSTFSEAGMFALLYGRSPLLYHSTLDAHAAPTWCAIAHRFAMDCSYFSGQPKVWMRLEEFLNPAVVDHFVHDDSGDWPNWDRTALQGAVGAIRGASQRSVFATVYLMSTHFEYQYPASYERHLPVLKGAKWPSTDIIHLDISNRAPLTNRYLNSLAFSDDLVTDAIEQLDPARTVIVVTGDHGESLGEDGRFGHAYSFADAIARVPFAIVGPGIPAGTRDTPSTHADVLRTLVHALGGQAEGPEQAQDLLAAHAPRSGLLLAHCSFDHDTADALLISGDRRIRLTLGLRKPTLKIEGPENTLGRAADTYALSPAQVAALQHTFETELDALWRSIPPPAPN
jgi:membrane-anchored protein YejM (alkaline phosphatase superfamily)